MGSQTASKLNLLQRALPEGLLVDAGWLSARGYSSSLRAKYVAAGWLEQPARRVFTRPRAPLDWHQVVVSLQAVLGHKLHVGGRTALEQQGYAHYLPMRQVWVHLHGPERPPTWLSTLPLEQTFEWRSSRALFGDDLAQVTFPTLEAPGASEALLEAGLRVKTWGQWSWPFVVSTPERAALELMDALPDRETFHGADMLMEGLAFVRPELMQRLLERCRSVKAKRLFLFFADRHRHDWLADLDRKAIDLGSGKRQLVKGGLLDSVYNITLPRDLPPEEVAEDDVTYDPQETSMHRHGVEPPGTTS